MKAAWILRPVRADDDAAIAATIRDVMTEHGCTGEGFAIHDDEVTGMADNYAGDDAGYYVIERGGEVLGGGGYARLEGTAPADGICELRKMYFRPAARGHGLGHALITLLLDEMARAGYRRCYLETTSWMAAAQHLYTRHGFREIPDRLGATGHHGCDRFFARNLA